MISRVCDAGRVCVVIRVGDYPSSAQSGTMRDNPSTRRSFNDQTPAQGVYAAHGSKVSGYYFRSTRYTVFVRPRDPEREIWDGRRAGVDGAKSDFGADESFPIADFESKLADFLDGAEVLYYRLGVDQNLDNTIVQEIVRMRGWNRKPIHPPQTIVDPATIVHEMRVFKNADEIEIMQQAADIAAEAHCEAMKAAKPGMQEYQIEALIEQIFRRHGASGPAYTSIVGAGPNATVLHYINNDGELRDGDLLLVDAGAEYKGYASDITRTFPINGRY